MKGVAIEMKSFAKLKEGDIIINPTTFQMRLIDTQNGELVVVDSDGFHSLEEFNPAEWFVI